MHQEGDLAAVVAENLVGGGFGRWCGGSCRGKGWFVLRLRARRWVAEARPGVPSLAEVLPEGFWRRVVRGWCRPEGAARYPCTILRR